MQVHGDDEADDQPAVENQVGTSPNAHDVRQGICLLGKEYEIYAGKRDERYGFAQETRFLPLHQGVEEAQQQTAY